MKRILLTLSIAWLTGCSHEQAAPRTVIAATDTPAADGMAHGTHDPKFGGVVMMNGKLHFEIVAKDGGYQLYFSDEARRELPASVVSNLKIGVSRPGYRSEPVEMKVSDTGESWEGRGGSVNEKDVTLMVSFDYQGEHRTSDVPYDAAAGK